MIENTETIKTLDRDFLTQRQVMELLNCSRDTLYKWRRDGLLNYLRFDKKILFQRAELERFLQSRLVQN